MGKGLKDIFQGFSSGASAILSLPAFGQKMLIAIVAIGGIALLLLVGGLSWGIGSGSQRIDYVIKETGGAAKEIAPLAMQATPQGRALSMARR